MWAVWDMCMAFIFFNSILTLVGVGNIFSFYWNTYICLIIACPAVDMWKYSPLPYFQLLVTNNCLNRNKSCSWLSQVSATIYNQVSPIWHNRSRFGQILHCPLPSHHLLGKHNCVKSCCWLDHVYLCVYICLLLWILLIWFLDLLILLGSPGWW